LANDTKWREFFELLPRDCRPVEVKLIDDDQAVQCGSVWSVGNYLDTAQLGPYLFVFIEWIRSTKTQPLQEAAAAVGLECVVSDGTATVYGYR